MLKIILKTKWVNLVLFLFVVGVACTKSVSLKKLVENPEDYANKEVQAEGKVVNSVGVIGMGYYIISDGRHQIFVLTQSGLPVEGRVVKVKGKFSQYLKAGLVQVSGIENGEIIQ